MGGGAAAVFYIGELITVSLYFLLGSLYSFPKFIMLQPFLRVAQGISYFRTWLTSTITWAGIKYNINFHGDVVRVERPEIKE